MINSKIVLGVVTTVITIVGSFAFKANAIKQFGTGTLFSKPAGGACHAINCRRSVGANMCSGFAPPFYTTSNCTGTQYDAAINVPL